MAMIAAVKFDDLIPPGISPSQPQGTHGRLGAAVYKADHLNVGHEIHYALGELQLERAGSAIGSSFGCRLLDRVDNLGMCMPGDEWPPRQDVIDEAVAVDIVKVRTFAPVYEERLTSHRAEGTHRRIDTAGKQFLCLLEERNGILDIHDFTFYAMDLSKRDFPRMDSLS